jgi:predicted nucleotidyltransferase
MDIYKLNFTIVEMEIISFLSFKAGEKFSQRDVAKILNVSPTAIKNSLTKLLNNKLINLEKTKTINFIYFNRDNPKAIEIKRIKNIEYLYTSGFVEYIEEKLAGSTIVLFGSYSKGEDTTESDIDIAVIERKNKNIDIEKFEKILNKKININFYETWDQIHKNLKNNILNGIVLIGSVNL